MKARLDYAKTAPALYKAILNFEMQVRSSGLEAGLLHLIKLRASQINGCAYCVDMHSKEALHDGENPQRLHLLVVWRESSLYTERERAALEWTEALTLIAQTQAPDDVYDRVSAQFTPEELVKLTTAIGTINIWNRISVAFRHQHPVDAVAA